jgi:uncharacterized protein YkwD
MRALALLLVSLWLLGCSSGGSAARGPAAPGGAAPVGQRVDSPGAGSYTTRPTPGGVRGGPDAERIEHALLEVTRARGLDLAGDGRLAELATFIAAAVDPTGSPPASAAVDAYSRHLGLVEPVPLFMVFGQIEEAGTPQTLEQMLRGAPKNVGYNRYGIVVVPRFAQRLAVVVLSAACVELEPVTRSAQLGSMLPLRGKLRDRYKHPQLEITLPNGTVKHVADKPGTDFDFAAPIAQRGIHRVEILADGPYGIEVLANFPVFAGVAEPPIVVGPATRPATEQPSDEAAVAARLFALLNDARKAANVPPLKEHTGLAEVARAHSDDMVSSGFFGHVSPVNGDPATRVRRKGLGFVLIAENVGRGSTAEEVNSMLLDSPGHRANALDANLTHVGIGVIIDQRGGHSQIVATEEFGGMSKSIDVASAPDDLLRIVNARRSLAGAPKLEVDPTLAEAARSGVLLFFREPSQPQEQIVQKVNNDIVRPVDGKASPVARHMRAAQSFLLPVISLEHATKIEQLFDPRARFVGIGVAQGMRPETGPSTIGVLVVIGWPR